MYHFSKIFAPTQSEKCFQSCCFHQLLPSSEKSSARKQPLMTPASTNAPASKRLSLHSLPPRQSLPTWLLVDHAFSSFFLKPSSICWVCPSSQSQGWRRWCLGLDAKSPTGAGGALWGAHGTLALAHPRVVFHPPLHYKCIQRILGIAFLFVLFIMLCTASELLRQFQDDSRNQKIHCCLSVVKARWQCFWDAIGLAPSFIRCASISWFQVVSNWVSGRFTFF